MNLKQLSTKLGLSQTTISRALGGYPEVSEATRKRVQFAAEQNNYRPNTRAKSLATGRAMAIGHVISFNSKNEVVNPIFSEFISGASETYANNGYELILTIAHEEDETKIYSELKSKRSVDGIIVHGPRKGDSRLEQLQEVGLPFVVHGRVSDSELEYSWIDVDNQQSFRRATNFLVDLGHKRIALINGDETMDFASRRRAGYLRALAEQGLSEDASIMRSAALTEVYGYRSTKELLSLPNSPTAFLVSSYIVAIGVRRAIHEFGLKLGTDVSVITHDDELSYFSDSDDVPQFTATRSSVWLAGRRAAEMLLDVIQNPEKPPRTELLKAELTVGASTGRNRRLSLSSEQETAAE
ncbi:MAG: LacI family DNA-binding transcriptional regulator [Hyphomicrobiales bacterium]